MALLLDQRGDQVTITEDVVKAAAGNSCNVVALLLGRFGNLITITKDVVKAAAGNFSDGIEVMHTPPGSSMETRSSLLRM